MAHTGLPWRSACSWARILTLGNSVAGNGVEQSGSSGAAPVPFPALPLELILTVGPTKVTPLASNFKKLPPPLAVRLLPALMVILLPAW